MHATQRQLLTILGSLAALGLVACGGSAPRGGADYAPSSPQAGEPAMAEEAPAGAPASPTMDDAGPSYGAPAPQPGMAGGARAASAEAEAPADAMAQKAAPAPESRPGLGTEWGESRFSKVTTAPFVRASSQSPFAVAAIYYNDRAGIDAMMRSWGGSPTQITHFPVWQGYLDVSIRGTSGQPYAGLVAGGRNYVTGAAGESYSIVVRNHSPGRVEVVATVDGLDVIDGRAGAYAKRGYLLGAHETLEIEGFRQSETQIAAFRFGAVSQSYAERKTGDSRNVGVIGVAFFHEQGDSPQYWLEPWRNQDANQRNQANPFPQRYATPPN